MSDLNLWKYPNSRGGAGNLWKYPNSRGGAGNIVASVGERLGWQRCTKCDGRGEWYRCRRCGIEHETAPTKQCMPEPGGPCPDCVGGWTPPAELVEGMVDFLFGSYDIEPSDARVIAYRFLLEQARWIGEQ